MRYSLHPRSDTLEPLEEAAIGRAFAVVNQHRGQVLRANKFRVVAELTAEAAENVAKDLPDWHVEPSQMSVPIGVIWLPPKGSLPS